MKKRTVETVDGDEVEILIPENDAERQKIRDEGVPVLGAFSEIEVEITEDIAKKPATANDLELGLCGFE